MTLWHKAIETDVQFNEHIAQEISNIDFGSPYGGNHPLVRQMLYELGIDDGTRGVGCSDERVSRVTSIIGGALLNMLLEANPGYIKRILAHAFRITCDAELHKLEMRSHYNRMGMNDFSIPDNIVSNRPSVLPKLRNEDYEFWWEYSDDENEIYVMSDYDGTPENGLMYLEFDPDDVDERSAAEAEADAIVKKLYSNELDLNNMEISLPSKSESAIDMGRIRNTLTALYPQWMDFQ